MALVSHFREHDTTLYLVYWSELAILAVIADLNTENQPQAATVKPVYNDHLYNKIYYLWFIQ